MKVAKKKKGNLKKEGILNRSYIGWPRANLSAPHLHKHDGADDRHDPADWPRSFSIY